MLRASASVTGLPNVAIAGNAGSGKTTAAEYLVARWGYRRVSLADPLKKIAEELFDVSPQTKAEARKIYQALGQSMRDIDSYCWIRALGKYMRALREEGFEGPFVIDDARYVNEAQAASQAGFVLIYLDVPEPQRLQRLDARDGRADASIFEHQSEREAPLVKRLAAEHGYVFENTGDLAHMQHFLEQVIQSQALVGSGA